MKVRLQCNSIFKVLISNYWTFLKIISTVKLWNLKYKSQVVWIGFVCLISKITKLKLLIRPTIFAFFHSKRRSAIRLNIVSRILITLVHVNNFIQQKIILIYCIKSYYKSAKHYRLTILRDANDFCFFLFLLSYPSSSLIPYHRFSSSETLKCVQIRYKKKKV